MAAAPSLISSGCVLAKAIVENIVYTIFAFDSRSSLQRTAIFLIFFLIIHCSGNLLLFKNDKGDQFNAYGYFLRNSPIIIIIETYLLIATIIHSCSALYIVVKNEKYKSFIKSGKTKYSGNDTWIDCNRIRLSFTGTIILAFLIIHLYDFRFGKEYEAPKLKSMLKNPWYELLGYGEKNVTFVRDLYRIQMEVFKDVYHCIFYIACMYFLSIHLKHGWDRANIRIIPKEHRSNTKMIINLGFDFLCLLFALTVACSYLSIHGYMSVV
mgnify:CR=1 FL=1|jgi:succinate dehydrogenase / fumarate reductase, cytochrome b subunit